MAKGIFTLRQVNQAIRQSAWSAFNPPQWVEYLVVAGGGSGGVESYQSGTGGGGGAGGLLTGIVPVTAGTSYTVTVGSGGAQVQGTGPGAGSKGNNGTDSIFSSITAIGGGAGSGGSGSGNVGVGSGGSGGGGKGLLPGGSGILGQGNAGGTPAGGGATSGSVNAYWTGSGGGGAGTVGLNSTSDSIGANGGAGIASAISGTVTTYAGGGGSGTQGIATLGGVGGGGSGGRYVNTNAPARNGASNSGGGGGGAANEYNFTTGAGGSGIVIVRYPGNVQFYTGGAVTYANGHVVHTFYVTDTLAPTTPTALATSDYQISRSLRFNEADSAYLNRTPATATNQKTWTWSGWVKRTGPTNPTNAVLPFFGVTNAGNDSGFFVVGALGDVISIQGWNTVHLRTTTVYRDYSAWQHIVVALDTTQSTAANRLKLYVNGVQETAFSFNTPPTLNADYPINGNVAHNIFSETGVGSYELGGYLTEVNFIDGQALTPSSFGETNSNTGVWQPKAYTGTYGTNGFYLNFSDNSNTTAATLGKDYSGNGNNWTPNNFSVTAGVGNDSLLDTPTPYGTDTGLGGEVRGNYCTFNPLDKATTVTLSNGNLDLIGTNGGGRARASMAVSSGKWYFEFLMVDVSGGGYNGFMATSARADVTGGGGTTDLGVNADTWGIPNFNGGYARNSGTNGAAITGITNGQIGMYALDMDTGQFWYGINGTWANSGNPVYSNLGGYTVAPAIGHGGSTVISYSYNFGQRPFAYTAPSGYKALCTANLPTPAIGASPTSLASKFFNTITYSGSGSQSVTGVGFQPDFVWVKSRSSGAYNHQLHDAVRGATAGMLNSNAINAQDSSYQFDSFDSDGFTTDASNITGINNSGQTFVAWNWKASNASAVTNTSGSITSSVSANPTAGFSIVTYTGNSVAGATRGHGLNAVPKMFFVKGRVGPYGADHWHVYHASLPNTQGLSLNSTGGATTSSYFWNDTSPTSTVFTTSTGSSNNFSGQTYVAYCFAEVAGYSAFGSYTGNGSADGPFVFTGFRSAFIMIKRTDTSGDWVMVDSGRDPYNVAQYGLYANQAISESSFGSPTPMYDFNSNGFKIRNIFANTNSSGGTYVYMAFASNPFKYSLAR